MKCEGPQPRYALRQRTVEPTSPPNGTPRPSGVASRAKNNIPARSVTQSPTCGTASPTGATWKPTNGTASPTGATWKPTNATASPTSATSTPTSATWMPTSATASPTRATDERAPIACKAAAVQRCATKRIEPETAERNSEVMADHIALRKRQQAACSLGAIPPAPAPYP